MPAAGNNVKGRHLASGRDHLRPRGVTGHMPFFGHRTMAEVIEEENRAKILRSLGKGPKVVRG